MKHLIFTALAFVAAMEPALASNCFQSFGGICLPQRRVVRRVIQHAQNAVVVQKQVPVVNQQIFYPVGQPLGAAYNGLQVAQYGQIERQVQRMIDRLSELKQYQQQFPQQYSVPIQQPQYAAPAPQYAPPQYAAPQCQACGAPMLQQQQYGQPPTQHNHGYQQPATGVVGSRVLLQQKCAACHTGAQAKGNFHLEELDRLSVDDRAHVLSMAASGEMPKDRPDLSREELGQLALELFTVKELEERLPPPAEQIPAEANGAR